MYLFFDTETTGLPNNWKSPVSDVDNWPRLVQIAWLVYSDDGELLDSKDYILRPYGFTIPEDAAKVHGITTEMAYKSGLDSFFVLSTFEAAIRKADTLVAHNMSFDFKIAGAEFYRHKMNSRIFDIPKICTMESSVNYCKLPGKYGFKWPKLSELHIHLFGEDFEEAHNAAFDIKATAKCFWKLKELGIIS